MLHKRMKILSRSSGSANIFHSLAMIALLYTAIYRLGDQKPIHWTFLAFKILQNNTPSLYKVLKACANFC